MEIYVVKFDGNSMEINRNSMEIHVVKFDGNLRCEIQSKFDGN